MRNAGEGILYLGQEMNGTGIGKRTFVSGITSSELIVAVKCHVKKASEAVLGPKGKIWEKIHQESLPRAGMMGMVV